MPGGRTCCVIPGGGACGQALPKALPWGPAVCTLMVKPFSFSSGWTSQPAPLVRNLTITSHQSPRGNNAESWTSLLRTLTTLCPTPAGLPPQQSSVAFGYECII